MQTLRNATIDPKYNRVRILHVLMMLPGHQSIDFKLFFKKLVLKSGTLMHCQAHRSKILLILGILRGTLA